MPAIVVPKTRVLSGAGYLYRAPLGSLLPGQTSSTATNKARASNVATLTTSTAHGFTTGDEVTVTIGDATFDGTHTVTDAPTSTTLTYASTGADVTSTSATGTVTTSLDGAGGTVAGSVFTDAWPSAWVPIGVTEEGHEWSWEPDTEPIEAAEYLLPLSIETVGVEGKVSFKILEYTGSNLAFALNGGVLSTVSGSGATLLTRVAPPTPGTEVRQMIGWESNDGTERGVFRQVFQTGELTVAHQKGANPAGLEVEFSMEQPSVGEAFYRYLAGETPVGA